MSMIVSAFECRFSFEFGARFLLPPLQITSQNLGPTARSRALSDSPQMTHYKPRKSDDRYRYHNVKPSRPDNNDIKAQTTESLLEGLKEPTELVATSSTTTQSGGE